MMSVIAWICSVVSGPRFIRSAMPEIRDCPLNLLGLLAAMFSANVIHPGKQSIHQRLVLR